MKKREGDWFLSRSGIQLFPLDPRVEDIAIEDIAHALSLTCRYNGHCPFHYSVASHSMLVAEQVSSTFALEGLLHDASEAYLTDVVRPLKPFLTNYKQIEAEWEAVIARKFGLVHPWPKPVKQADDLILAMERHFFFPYDPKRPWVIDHLRPQIELMVAQNPKWEFLFSKTWDPKEVESDFLYQFKRLSASRE